MANQEQMLNMLKELTDARAIPGDEREARQVMEKWITPICRQGIYGSFR